MGLTSGYANANQRGGVVGSVDALQLCCIFPCLLTNAKAESSVRHAVAYSQSFERIKYGKLGIRCPRL